MKNTTRTDIHRPVDFDPEAYTFVGAYDNDTSARSDDEVEYEPFDRFDGADVSQDILDSMAEAAAAGRIPYGDGYRCDHCGARIRYVGIFRHDPTGDYVAIGEKCADRMTYTKAEFDRLRKAAALDAKDAAARAEWEQFRADRPEIDWATLAGSTNEFIVDVLRRGRQYGSISPRQIDAVVAAYQRDVEWEAGRAEREANAPVPASVPTGNGIALRGKVLACKWVDHDFGSTLKMLVEVTSDEGVFKVWGTVPSAINPAIDDLVEFVANVEASRDDESFGFFKRPRKAVVVDAAA